MPRNDAAIAAITAKAAEIGWPRLWSSDLTIDAQVLALSNAPEKFGWILRELGTHICETADKVRDVASPSAFGHQELRCYYFDGQRLTEYAGPKSLIARMEQEAASARSTSRAA